MIFIAGPALVGLPHDVEPAHRLPLTSMCVPLGKITVEPAWMISFAPGAMVTSPVKVCVPAQVSVPVIVPSVVSLEANTVFAGSANETTMLSKNKQDMETELRLRYAAMNMRASSGRFNHRDGGCH